MNRSDQAEREAKRQAVIARMDRFVVVFPSGAVRGSYPSKKEADYAAERYGFIVVEVSPA